MAKIKNAEKEFFFDLSEPGEVAVAGTKYVDLMQVHSLCNRISARQGMEVAIQSIEVGCKAGGSFSFTIQRLPSHYPCINGWEKAMRHWLKQQNEQADEAGVESMKSKYRDFKIFFDGDHQGAGVAGNLIPSGFTVTAPGTGGYDWDASQVVIPNDGGVAGNTQEYNLHMLGDDEVTSMGIIKAYAESRARPHDDDPNIVTSTYGGLYAEMTDVGEITDEVIVNYSQANNNPPYIIDVNTADEYYPGGTNQGTGPIDSGGNVVAGNVVDILSIGGGANFNSDRTVEPILAPCGLLKLTYDASGVGQEPEPLAPGRPPSSFWMKITLAPGMYKGIAARSMVVAN